MRPHTERWWGLFISRCPSPALEIGKTESRTRERLVRDALAKREAGAQRQRGRESGEKRETTGTAQGDTLDRCGCSTAWENPVFTLQHPGFSPCESFSHPTNDWTWLAPFGAYTGLLSLDVIGAISGVPGASGTKWSEPSLSFVRLLPISFKLYLRYLRSLCIYVAKRAFSARLQNGIFIAFLEISFCLLS